MLGKGTELAEVLVDCFLFVSLVWQSQKHLGDLWNSFSCLWLRPSLSTQGRKRSSSPALTKTCELQRASKWVHLLSRFYPTWCKGTVPIFHSLPPVQSNLQNPFHRCSRVGRSPIRGAAHADPVGPWGAEPQPQPHAHGIASRLVPTFIHTYPEAPADSSTETHGHRQQLCSFPRGISDKGKLSKLVQVRFSLQKKKIKITRTVHTLTPA